MTTPAASKKPEGRYGNVSVREARAAARAQVTIDKRRGRDTPQWIVELSKKDLS